MSQNLRVTGPVRMLDIRVFQHATEDRDRVVGALRFVSGTEEFRCSLADVRALQDTIVTKLADYAPQEKAR